MPEKTLLACADHGGPVELMRPDLGAAQRCIAEVAGQGVDSDALAESLQRQGARAFEADWAAQLEAIGAKTKRLSK